MIYLKLERRRPIKLEMRGSHYEEEKKEKFCFCVTASALPNHSVFNRDSFVRPILFGERSEGEYR